MKSLLTYISEAMSSNYEEFKSRLEDVKAVSLVLLRSTKTTCGVP